MEQNSGASLPTCTALTSHKEGPSAHLQKHKQAGDGGAHTVPTDPAGWAPMSPGVSISGERTEMCALWVETGESSELQSMGLLEQGWGNFVLGSPWWVESLSCVNP